MLINNLGYIELVKEIYKLRATLDKFFERQRLQLYLTFFSLYSRFVRLKLMTDRRIDFISRQLCRFARVSLVLKVIHKYRKLNPLNINKQYNSNIRNTFWYFSGYELWEIGVTNATFSQVSWLQGKTEFHTNLNVTGTTATTKNRRTVFEKKY